MTTTPRQHSPLLLNAEAHADYRPTAQQIEGVRLHQHVEVALAVPPCLWGEPCWLEVCLRSSTYWVGIVRSQLQFVKGIAVGDLVRFHPINVLKIAPAMDEPI